MAAAVYAGEVPGTVPVGGVSDRVGGVAAHAATIVALALFAARTIRRRWLSVLVTLCALAICYSRIYLGKHFPMDLVWGALVGAVLGGAACAVYQRLTDRKTAAD